MHNSRASGGKVVSVRHGVHDWSLTLQCYKSQKELTHSGCQLLYRDVRVESGADNARVNIQPAPVAALKLLASREKGANVQLNFYLFKLADFKTPPSWNFHVRERQFYLCNLVIDFCVIHAGSEFFGYSVSSNLRLADFRAQFVSDPSHEGRESVLETSLPIFPFKFSYDRTSFKVSVGLT